jgi:hypothetical protein
VVAATGSELFATVPGCTAGEADGAVFPASESDFGTLDTEEPPAGCANPSTAAGCVLPGSGVSGSGGGEAASSFAAEATSSADGEGRTGSPAAVVAGATCVGGLTSDFFNSITPVWLSATMAPVAADSSPAVAVINPGIVWKNPCALGAFDMFFYGQ